MAAGERLSWVSIAFWALVVLVAVLVGVDRFWPRAPESVAPAAQREVLMPGRPARAPGVRAREAQVAPGPPRRSFLRSEGPRVLTGPDGQPIAD